MEIPVALVAKYSMLARAAVLDLASQLGGGGARVQPLQLDVASAECVRTTAAAVESDEAGGLDGW